ncbi:MAG TPA: hypothetical protein VM490_18125, partial [Armatimonadaceae bacterium]|nr:hypothetical protein [Armatimonadaceae bacterium]
MRLTPIGKLAIFLVVVGAVIGGYRLFARTDQGAKVLPGILGGRQEKVSGVPTVGELPSDPGESGDEGGGATGGGASVVPVVNEMPGSEPGCTDKPEVRMLVWAWNSQMGLMYANGGPQAAKGSLMCGQGVNLKLSRQDDPTKMQEALVAFATALSKGEKNPKDGAHFVAIMGDGGAAFLKGLNDTLRKLGPEYTAKVVGSAGYSRGEDRFMGPPAWKNNPQAAVGGVVSGYLRDGDWNIAQKWLADNGLKNNPDEKTYDPEALNWVSTNDYIDAAEKYVSGYTEERPVVRNGKPTGQKKRITVQGVVTWTPGDVTVAKKKGG